MRSYALHELLAGEIDRAGHPPIRFAGVRIPLLQRDYAQGRQAEGAVRDRLLTSLFGALTGGPPLTLDFVYGSVQRLDGQPYFVPLDGQQRLTTLFLLYWYLANRELTGAASQAVRAYLRRFSYATRPTARAFCEQLTQTAVDPTSKPKRAIRRQTWFYASYGQDPTVRAMLRMLNAIHARYPAGGTAGLFARLENLRFHVLPLDGFGLADELYVKMNARGKQLTGFEHFKADLLGWLADAQNPEYVVLHQPTRLHGQEMPYHLAWATKLDTNWTSLLWELGYRGPALAAAGLRVWNRLLAAHHLLEPNPDALLTHRLLELDKGQEIPGYPGFAHYELLLARPGTIAAAERLLDGLAAHHPAISGAIAATWGEPAAGWHLLAPAISQRQRVLFWAVTRYLDAPAFDEAALRRWLRVTRNLSSDPDVRLGAVLRLVDRLAAGAGSIYAFLTSAAGADLLAQERGLLAAQLTEEQHKASLVLADEAWEAALVASEQHGLFQGSISFLLAGEPTLVAFRHRAALAAHLFAANGPQGGFAAGHLLLRGVISEVPTWDQPGDGLLHLRLADSGDNWWQLLRKNTTARALVGRLVELATPEAARQELRRLVARPSALTTPASHLLPRVRLVHERLYQRAGLQRWLQAPAVQATRLKWKDDHPIAYQYYGREHTRVVLDTYRHELASGLIRDLGFRTAQQCGNSPYYWGDGLTLVRQEADWLIRAEFSPFFCYPHPLRVGVRRQGADALRVTELVTATDQDDEWLLRVEYDYARVTSTRQARVLVQTIRRELFDSDFFAARLRVADPAGSWEG